MDKICPKICQSPREEEATTTTTTTIGIIPIAAGLPTTTCEANNALQTGKLTCPRGRTMASGVTCTTGYQMKDDFDFIAPTTKDADLHEHAVRVHCRAGTC